MWPYRLLPIIFGLCARGEGQSRTKRGYNWHSIGSFAFSIGLTIFSKCLLTQGSTVATIDPEQLPNFTYGCTLNESTSGETHTLSCYDSLDRINKTVTVKLKLENRRVPPVFHLFLVSFSPVLWLISADRYIIASLTVVRIFDKYKGRST